MRTSRWKSSKYPQSKGRRPSLARAPAQRGAFRLIGSAKPSVPSGKAISFVPCHSSSPEIAGVRRVLAIRVQNLPTTLAHSPGKVSAAGEVLRPHREAHKEAFLRRAPTSPVFRPPEPCGRSPRATSRAAPVRSRLKSRLDSGLLLRGFLGAFGQGA